MYDRDEFLRARIDNYLHERRARIERVTTGSGIIAVREAARNGITVGSFADSKREYKKYTRPYFIESPTDEHGVARQLWLPALKWVTLGTIREREIVSTASVPSERFDAWHAVQPLVTDLEGYSEYKGEGQALYEEAKLSLEYIDANDDNFISVVKTIKL